jgi:CRP/FNR family transcriptional regulator, anaerobic regulatory protein
VNHSLLEMIFMSATWHSHYPELAQLPDTLLQEIAQLRPHQIPAGQMVFNEQQPCAGFPLLLEGAIRVYKRAANGRELLLYRVLPGDTCVLSSGCLLAHQAYKATASCEVPSLLLVLPAVVFEQCLQVTAFRQMVFAVFGERLAELMQLVEAVAFSRLDQRLAGQLLGRGQHLQLTHQALADELGSVREIISRLLKHFAEQGWVALEREHIEIINPAALRALSAGQ